jgi:ABC-2 type transport system permease protein
MDPKPWMKYLSDWQEKRSLSMNRFWSFVRKEFLHILRDRRTVLIMFGLPVVQVVLFGFAITTEIRDANIAILDMSKDHVTRNITSKILSTGYFKLDRYLENEDEVNEVFQEGRVKEVILFHKDFASEFMEGNARVHLIADATDPNTGTTLINYTSAIMQDYIRSENIAYGFKIPLNIETRMWYNPELKGVYYFIPGVIALILMIVSAMLTSISLTREKELGTMEVLLASPMKPGQVIVAKVIPYLSLSFINALLILILGRTIFGLPMEGSTGLLLTETFLFIVLALALGILISTRAQTQQVALMVSLFALLLPTVLLSGFIFPVENMPWILRVISNIIPAKWFVIIVKEIMLKGSGILDIWKETLIMIGFIIVFIGASIKNYKIRLE